MEALFVLSYLGLWGLYFMVGIDHMEKAEKTKRPTWKAIFFAIIFLACLILYGYASSSLGQKNLVDRPNPYHKEYVYHQ